MKTVDSAGREVHTHVRIYSDGQHEGSKQGFVSYVVAVATLGLYVGWLQFLLALLIASWHSRLALTLLIAIMGTTLLPLKPLLWKRFCDAWVFKCWREYFKFSYLFEEALDHNKRYIFVEFPHGVFPMGPLLAGTMCTKMFPEFDIFSLAASSVFNIPGWRHFSTWIGSVPATSSNFKRLLRKGSVAVIVGGIAEIFMGSAVCENAMVLTRKGFVRVAVEEGIDGGIVPVYHMGNSLILDWWPQWLSGPSRRLRAALGVQYGQWGLPLPRSRPICMVMGKPIAVNKFASGDPGYEAEVDRVHALVVKELKELYDRHKGMYGWSDRPLVLH
uniref:Acyltransferase n=1 Tax=Chlamydomonas euryale TaxID=1486919 RepID=A0A6U2EVD0_9CHLO|mmetsp:Transcript_2518/g.6704  ORF Transcript_2518/g.6704 Transcript_2518/m.6704 type:complete len:330 (+) Transcript_2518:199-1188(+)